MSIEVQNLCWKLRLSATEKLVLVRLAVYADHDGTSVYPAVATVANDCGISDRAVQITLKKLIATGILVLMNAGGGRSKTTEYAIDLDKIRSQLAKQAGEIAKPENGAKDENPEDGSGYVATNPERGSQNPEGGSPDSSLRVINTDIPFKSPVWLSGAVASFLPSLSMSGSVTVEPSQASEPDLFGGEPSVPTKPTKPTKPKRSRRQVDYSADFLRFWELNPDRGPDGHNKKRSKANWEAAIEGGASPEDMIRGWGVYAESKRTSADWGTQWVKSAQNFLDPEERMWTRFQTAPNVLHLRPGQVRNGQEQQVRKPRIAGVMG
jgi:hypothetical protein